MLYILRDREELVETRPLAGVQGIVVTLCSKSSQSWSFLVLGKQGDRGILVVVDISLSNKLLSYNALRRHERFWAIWRNLHPARR
jgi:hypothetical protein